MRHIDPYRARRARLLAAMRAGVAIVPTAPERLRNRDSDYLYRFDSYFYYLTGFPEPEAVLVLVGGDAPRSILFCREKSPERELWDGSRVGFEAAREEFGVDEAHPVSALDGELPGMLANQPTLFFAPGLDPAWDARVLGWLNQVRAQARTGVGAPGENPATHQIGDEMCLVKDAHEVAPLRRAAPITAGAHVRAMRAARPGMM